jgi:hypothetical protein
MYYACASEKIAKLYHCCYSNGGILKQAFQVSNGGMSSYRHMKRWKGTMPIMPRQDTVVLPDVVSNDSRSNSLSKYHSFFI